MNFGSTGRFPNAIMFGGNPHYYVPRDEARAAYDAAYNAFWEAKQAYQTTYTALQAMKNSRDCYERSFNTHAGYYQTANKALQEEKANTIGLKTLMEAKEKELNELTQKMEADKNAYEQLKKNLELAEATIKEKDQENHTLKSTLDTRNQELISQRIKLEQSQCVNEEQAIENKLLQDKIAELFKQNQELKKAHSKKVKNLEQEFKDARLNDRQEIADFMKNVNMLQNQSAASSVVSSQANSPEASPPNSPR